jgi:hypothetical protein
MEVKAILDGKTGAMRQLQYSKFGMDGRGEIVASAGRARGKIGRLRA